MSVQCTYFSRHFVEVVVAHGFGSVQSFSFIDPCPPNLIFCRATKSMLHFLISSDRSLIFPACNNVCIFHVANVANLFSLISSCQSGFLERSLSFSLCPSFVFSALLWSFFLPVKVFNLWLNPLARRARARGPRARQTRCICVHP